MIDGLTVTKAEILEDALQGRGCLGRAAEDEPVFVIRARDLTAVRVLSFWCDQAELEGAPDSKVKDARKVQMAMVIWRSNNPVKVPT